MQTLTKPAKITSGNLVLVSASLLSFVLGSVHAFSVFLEPLEAKFDITRSTASLAYSLALVSLTLAVLFGHTIFKRLRPDVLVSGICLMAATGALLAAFAPVFLMVWIGYSLLFGAANGLGYGFGLQLSAQANPSREGMAMGIVTASYALGAMVASPVFSWAVFQGGFQLAMLGLAGTMILIAPLCVLLLKGSDVRFRSSATAGEGQTVSGRTVSWLWIGYGTGVAAGLMAIGHATGIAGSAGLEDALWIAPLIIALLNLAGSLTCGWLIDRSQPLLLLAGLPLISAGALLLIALAQTGITALAGLGLVGFAYGAIIAVYPSVIAKLFGAADSPRIYGRVFTAWGTAGLFAPWLAGLMFDQTGRYSFALVTAAILAMISSAAICYLFRDGLLKRKN